METKFTKGQWWVNYTGPHWNNPEIANYEICFTEDREAVVDHVYELADAHLIASAPDMYEMLEEIVVILSQDATHVREAYIGYIDELLAKARGEK